MHNRLAIFCGQRGAGKGTLVSAMTKMFPHLKRIPTHTTRSPRKGEVNGVDYMFVMRGEFDRLLRTGELIDWVDISETQRSGPSKTELLRHPFGVTDVIPRMAKSIQGFVRPLGGEVMVIGVRAPLEQRRERIRMREPGISDAEVARLIEEDPVLEADVLKAEVVIHNDIQGDPQRVIQTAAVLVGEFIGRG